MNKELFISSTPHETKVAVVEDDQLAEIYFERDQEYTLAGSIYKGRVTRVLPGMQSAFVDIGLERDAFLYVTDFLEETDEQDEIDQVNVPQQQPQARSQRDFARSAAAEPQIQPHLIRPEAQAPEGGDAGEEADGEGAEAGGETEDGVRRWRGRRRRGRGRRGRGFEPRTNGAPAEAAPEAEEAGGPDSGFADESTAEDSDVDAGEELDVAAAEDAAEPAEAEAGEREPREREPREREFRGRDRESRGREFHGGRGGREGRESWGPPPGFQPIVLPGESLAKYGRSGEPPAEPAGGRASTPSPLTPPRRRPSTEVDDITSVREVRAADRGRSREPGPQILAGAAPVQEMRHGPGPEVLGDTPDHAAAPTREAFFAEPRQPEPEPVEQRYDQMNVAAVFGGEEAKPEAEQTDAESSTELAPVREYDRSEAVTGYAEAGSEPPQGGGLREIRSEVHEPEILHENVPELPEHGAPGGTSLDNEPVFAPGEGHVEEEEIEEDEAELAVHPPGEEEEDFEELEEEVLDRIAADQHQARVQQIAEAVEEGQIDQAAIEGEEQGASEYAPAGEVEAAEAEGDEFAEEEMANGEASAEVRGPAGTANLQQQRTERPQFDRRRRERGGRRGGGRRGPMGRREFHKPQMISDLLKEGQEILVQIAKEPIGKKGARITSHIALPGRFLVYMPTVNHIGVSRKISSEEERQRLKRIVISERENGLGGFIVRTAADRAPEDELRADIRFLKNLWHEIRQRADQGRAPALIYHDLNLVERILRDQVNENFSAIWVDTESDYERMLRFVNRFQPALVKRVKLYTKETPLFEQFNIQEEINKALKSKVWLKSGGYIVINQTEALVAIDVNTGKYVGKTQRLEDTIVKTNVDAIKEIVRQVRLRDLGGIIVIDFIDMDERRNRQKVMQALEEALRSDRAPSKVLQFNDFGLVAITRKRVKQSLERTLGSPCSYCSGTGFTKAVSTVCNEIWVEMRKMARHFDHPDIMLRVHPEVAKALKANSGRWIQEIEELTKRNLIVKSDPLLHQEQFDIN